MTYQEILIEWGKVVDSANIYIYGAAWGAKEVFEWLHNWGYSSKLRGFLVTSKYGNPESLCNLPVSEASSLKNKTVRILVPHLGDYRKQINEYLQNLCFTDVQNIGVLCSKTRYLQSGRELPLDKEDFIIPGTYQHIIDDYRSLRQTIIRMLKDGNPDFGNYKPYQSLELIGLDGIRPTGERMLVYDFLKYLTDEMCVLDIGCNTGFLDMAVAGYVRRVTGIEYDKSLHHIGQLVLKSLEINNVELLCCDIKNWFVNNLEMKCKYDAIFSFAVHHWIDMSAHEYVQQLFGIMKKHTLLWLESHGKEYDPMYVQMVDEFLQLGFEKVIESEIKDDKMTARDFVLLRR